MAGSGQEPKGPPRIVGDLLRGDSSTFGNILRNARRLEKLDQEFKSLLEPAARDQAHLAAVREQSLVIVTTSAALATRLRMDSTTLIHNLQSRGFRNINSLQVRVVPATGSQMPERTKRRLPEVARQCLERFAEDTGDDELHTSLMKNAPGPDESEI